MKIRNLVAAVAVMALSVAFAATASARTPAPRYYLSLGDSLSVGYQPLPSGQGTETDAGYANDLLTYEQRSIRGLALVEVGCPGDTTGSLLTGKGNAKSARQFHCDRRGGSQLKAAVAFLKAHHQPGEVPLVTIDIGANNVDGCTAPGQNLSTCLAAGEASIRSDTPKILNALRRAAPARTAFAAMNLYDPFLFFYLEPTSSLHALAEPSVALAQSVNANIAAADNASHFKTADVFTAFDTTDTTPVSFLGQTVPANVTRICTLTWMCAASPVGPNIHANRVGYATIAGAFEKVVGRLH